MKLSILPFRSANALTDLENDTINISFWRLAYDDCDDVLLDELGHLISNSPDHDDAWKNACVQVSGRVPDHNNKFDGLRRRLGIPETISANIGNITGIQQILTDYHLLQSYRRFSQRLLSNEGHWELLGNNKIKLYPTPKGSFPVVVLYVPSIETWRTPANRLLAMDMVLSESMIMLGNSRSKFAGIPSPDGGTLTLNGTDLVQKGYELRDKVMEQAMLLSNDAGAATVYRY